MDSEQRGGRKKTKIMERRRKEGDEEKRGGNRELEEETAVELLKPTVKHASTGLTRLKRVMAF